MNQSRLEAAFETRWDQLTRDLRPHPPNPTQQVMFSLEREYRFDAAFIDKLVYVELHGGGFSGGRHNREYGMVDDFTKYNLAVTMGWRGVYATSSMIDNDPQSVVDTVLALLAQPVLAPDYELTMWTARIRNLTKVGEQVTHNGIRIRREKRNRFALLLSGREYQTAPADRLIDGQREALNLILHGSSDASTPVLMRQQSKTSAQVALFP